MVLRCTAATKTTVDAGKKVSILQDPDESIVCTDTSHKRGVSSGSEVGQYNCFFPERGKR
jgi:hypothetical protein